MTDFVAGIAVEVVIDPDMLSTEIQSANQQGPPLGDVIIIHINLGIENLGL